jgi:ABC-type glycerol-3-phosphate transport system substrate-binding protein
VVALVLVVSVAAACDDGQDEVTRITVMVSGDPEEIEAYRAVITAFNRSQTGIDADLLPFADRDDLIVRLSTSIAGGEPPDLFLMNYRYYGQFAARDALEPVDTYLEGSEASSAGDFFGTAMTPFQWQGRQVCLPQNVSSLVVYYNADRFAEAGLPLPAEGWTWDDMVRSARALTRDDDGDGTTDVYGLGVDPEIIRLAPLIWSNGGSLVDDEAAPTRFDFDAPAVTAMQRFIDLRSLHEVTPTDEEAESEDLETRFLNDRLGMLMESPPFERSRRSAGTSLPSRACASGCPCFTPTPTASPPARTRRTPRGASSSSHSAPTASASPRRRDARFPRSDRSPTATRSWNRRPCRATPRFSSTRSPDSARSRSSPPGPRSRTSPTASSRRPITAGAARSRSPSSSRS